MKGIKRLAAIIGMGIWSAAQAFADVKVSTEIDSDGRVSKGLSLGMLILIGIVVLSVVIGVGKGMAAYSVARDQEKKQILSSTLSSAVIALIVMMVIFGIVMLFLKGMGYGNLITF